MTEHVKALAAVRKAFGNDAIVVHKPEGLNYHIASSALRPGEQKGVLANLMKRFDNTESTE